MKFLGAIVGIGAIVLLGFSAVQWFTYSNFGVEQEEMIDAQVRQNQNAYSTFTQTAIETMGVAKAYQGALSAVIVDGIQGRYGEGGAKPLALAVKEAYPTIPQELFTKVANVIEAGRADFSAEQKTLISKVQGYRTVVRKPWSGFWLKAASFPTINLDDPKYNPIISENTKKSFDTGIDQGVTF